MKEFHDFNIQIPAGATGETATTCPECSRDRSKPNDRCLSVNVSDGVWYCHHCGWKGGLGGNVKQAAKLPQPIQQHPFSPWAVAFLQERRIPMSVVQRNKVGMTNIFMPQDDAVVEALVFPMYRDGKLINRKYRDAHKHFRLVSSAELIFVGLDDIADTTIFVEGEMDKLAFEAADYPNCVSVPNGAPPVNTKNYPAQFTFLEADEERLSKISIVILAGDADEPGRKLQAELARRLGPVRCKLVTWPEGCNDANATLMKYGIEGVKEAMEDLRDYPIEGVFDMASMVSEILAFHESGERQGLTTGWLTLDPFYTVKEGEWTLVTGVPSHGKSTWLDCLMLNMISRHQWSFAVCSPENSPLEQYSARLVEKWLRRPLFGSEKVSGDELRAGIEFLNPYVTFLLGKDGMDLDWILDRARTAVFRKGIKGLVIDPWNEIEHQRPKEKSETEYISDCLTLIRRFAREHRVHVWLVAHPMKPERGKGGKNWIPGPYDVSGSAHWRNKADNCITVWRDTDPQNYSHETRIHIQKIRFKETGKMGQVDLVFVPASSTYRDLSWR